MDAIAQGAAVDGDPVHAYPIEGRIVPFRKNILTQNPSDALLQRTMFRLQKPKLSLNGKFGKRRRERFGMRLAHEGVQSLKKGRNVILLQLMRGRSYRAAERRVLACRKN